MTAPLVLSLFPGIGLLDMAFELEGFCVVRGPDLLWGGDIRAFHPPEGAFAGIIGGPPCQMFSRLRHLNPNAGAKHGNLIPEFERVVREAQPEWFIMENVEDAPIPDLIGYRVHAQMLRDVWVGGVTSRMRRLSWGTPRLTTTTKQWFRFEQHSNGCTATFEVSGAGAADFEVAREAESAPLAICLAALAAVAAPVGPEGAQT